MSGYLKRYLVPAFWPVNRKERKWAPKARAGPHAKNSSIPLQIVVRDLLKLTDNIPETKKIIKAGEIHVDKKKRTDTKYPVGFMDVVEILSIKKYFRILINNKGLYAKEINATESSKKLCLIKNKKKIKGGKTQITLHDGRNIITDKNDYKVGDSVLISLPDQKIADYIKFEKNADSIVTSGKNIGSTGKITQIRDRKSMLEKSMVGIKTKDGELVVPRKYVMVGAV